MAMEKVKVRTKRKQTSKMVASFNFITLLGKNGISNNNNSCKDRKDNDNLS